MTDVKISDTDWPHAPPHWFVPNANYMITASTYLKQRLFHSSERLNFLQKTVFAEAELHGWQLHARAFMQNHYHLILQPPENAGSLSAMIQAIHSRTARWLNELDEAPDRRVWFQYRDTCLTFERSYLARLNYVHRNPERHKVVPNAENYRWCSCRWFNETSTPAFRKTVSGFKIDRVKVPDDFD